MRGQTADGADRWHGFGMAGTPKPKTPKTVRTVRPTNPEHPPCSVVAPSAVSTEALVLSVVPPQEALLRSLMVQIVNMEPEWECLEPRAERSETWTRRPRRGTSTTKLALCYAFRLEGAAAAYKRQAAWILKGEIDGSTVRLGTDGWARFIDLLESARRDVHSAIRRLQAAWRQSLVRLPATEPAACTTLAELLLLTEPSPVPTLAVAHPVHLSRAIANPPPVPTSRHVLGWRRSLCTCLTDFPL